MATLFISDLHLDPTHPETTQLFLKFLQFQASHADALYILGDFFEVWVGDDDASAFNQTIISALKALTTAGVPVYIMHGNRDFLLGEQFLHQTGCQLLADPSVIDLYGTPTLVMHGDTLCTEDQAYLRFREKAHNPAYQRWFLSLPLFIRKFIARLLRTLSARRLGKLNTTDIRILDANPDEVKQLIQYYQINMIIHGHTHIPSIQLNRIVLGDWHAYGSILVCKPNGQKRLITIK